MVGEGIGVYLTDYLIHGTAGNLPRRAMSDEVYDTLIHIEAQLMEASELFLTDKMSEAVYTSMVQGVMMSLPRLRAPQHTSLC